MLHQQDLTGGSLRLRQKKSSQDRQLWTLVLRLYLIPATDARVVIPFHRCRGSFGIGTILPRITFHRIVVQPPENPSFELPKDIPVRRRILSHTIKATNNEVIVEGPGKVLVIATVETTLQKIDFAATAYVSVDLNPAGSQSTINVSLVLSPSAPKKGDSARWEL